MFLELFGDPCSNPSILKIVFFVKEIIKLLFIIIPIGAIAMLSFDMAKNVINGDESNQRKNLNVFIRRIIMLVIVFLVPTIVRFFVSFLNENISIDNNSFLTCISVDKEMIDKQLKVYKDNCIKEKGTWDSINETCSVSVYVPSVNVNNKTETKSTNKSSTSSDITKGFVKKGNKIYYYRDGEKVKGKVKVKNGKVTDIYWFNKSSGALEGVSLGVKRIQQSGANCGPTSLNMVMSYYTQKTYDEKNFALKYGHGDNGFDRAAKDFGYKRVGSRPESMTKDRMLNILMKKRPIIMSVPAFKDGARGRLATALRYTGGSGHFLVISGLYKDTVIIKDPAGRKTSVPYKEVESVVNGYSYFKKK